MKKWVLIFVFSVCILCGITTPVYAYNLTFQDYPDVEFDTTYTVVYEDGKYIYTLVADIKGCSVLSKSMVYWSNDDDIVGGANQSEFLCYLSDGKYENTGSGSSIRTVYTVTYESDTLLYDDSGEFGIFVKLGVQLSSTAWEYYYLEFTSDEPIPDSVPTVTPIVTPAPTPEMSLDVEVNGSIVTCDYFTGGCDSNYSFLTFHLNVDGPVISEDTSVVIDSVDFIDGSGTYTFDNLKEGEYYFFKLLYEYQIDGEYFEEIIYESFYVEDEKEVIVLPEPILTLDVDVNNSSVICDYFTGGCDSNYSFLTFHWNQSGAEYSDENSIVIDSVDFVDGSGTFRYDNLLENEYYFFKLMYEYQVDGEFYTETIYYYFNTCDDGGGTVVIYNLHTLMRWLWNSVFALDIEYEGFTINFQQIFMFTLIVPLAIGLLFAAFGIYGANESNEREINEKYEGSPLRQNRGYSTKWKKSKGGKK